MKAVLDTNIVIYLQKGLLGEALPTGQYAISIITEMELLSFPGLNPSQKEWLDRFIADMNVIGIEHEVKRRAIEIRRDYRMRLPDAIIAASAIATDALLFTNDQRMTGIPNLQVRALSLRQER